MNLLQFKIATSHEVEEALTEYLVNELGAQGIEVRRRQDFITAQERHHSELVELSEIVDLPTDVEVIAYFAETAVTEEIKQNIMQKFIELESYGLATGEKVIHVELIKDEDWNQAWKKYYDVVSVTHDLTIVPEWIDYQAQPHEQIIRLDPGLSFGTGTHITTQLALLALEKVIRPNQKVLDLGTGSGILSIAAQKLGAKTIVATDLDDQAMTAAKININLNKSENIVLQESDLFENVHGKYDLIMANILTEILLLMVPNMDEYLAEDGQVIFSGIDIQQLPKLTAKLTEFGFEIKIMMQQERWVALIVTRKEED